MLICSYYCAVSTSVVLDDAFIYFRVVENIINIGMPIFNKGENYFVVTSPLWTYLLALLKSIFTGLSLEILAKYLWIISLIFASYFTKEIFSPLIKRWSVVIPCVFFLSPVIGSMMGNEIALLYVAIFGIIWTLVKTKYNLTGIFVGIGYLARGEFLLITLPILIYYFFFKENQTRNFYSIVKLYFPSILTAIAIIFAWHIYYWSNFHQIFPDTLRIKMIQGASGHWSLFQNNIGDIALWLFDNNFILLIFSAIGAIRFYKIFFIMSGYTLLHTFLYVILTIPFYHWYYYDYYITILIFLLLGVIVVIQFLISLIKNINRLPNQVLPAIQMVLALGVFLSFIWIFKVQFKYFLPESMPLLIQTYSEDQRYNLYRKLSAKLSSELTSSDIIMAGEVGILSYYLPKTIIRDAAGIGTPGLTDSTIGDWGYVIDKYKPRYLILIKLQMKDIKIFEYQNIQYPYRIQAVIDPDSKYFAGCILEKMY